MAHPRPSPSVSTVDYESDRAVGLAPSRRRRSGNLSQLHATVDGVHADPAPATSNHSFSVTRAKPSRKLNRKITRYSAVHRVDRNVGVEARRRLDGNCAVDGAEL